eukprot:g28441.t1
MIEFTLQFEREKIESEVMVLQLNKGNYRGMREELDRIDREKSLAGKTVEQQWQELLGVMQETQQKFIPRKKKHGTGRMRQPWLTREVRDSIKAKEKAKNVAKVNGKPEDWEADKDYQRATKKEIKREKIKYEDELHCRVLKAVAEEIVEALVVTFQDSLESGRIQEDWKMVNVTPLFKKGVRQKLENYRQIGVKSSVKDRVSGYLVVG